MFYNFAITFTNELNCFVLDSFSKLEVDGFQKTCLSSRKLTSPVIGYAPPALLYHTYYSRTKVAQAGLGI